MTSIESDQTACDGPTVRHESVFDGYITEAEYARRRGVTIRTCQRDRALRKAPPHVVLGNRVFYRIDSVRDWLEARERGKDSSAHSNRSANRR